MEDRRRLGALQGAEEGIMRGAKDLPERESGLARAEAYYRENPTEVNKSLLEFLRGQVENRRRIFGNPDEKITDIMDLKDVLRRNIGEAGNELQRAGKYEEDLLSLSDIYKNRLKEQAPMKYGPVGSDVPMSAEELSALSPEFADLRHKQFLDMIEKAQEKIRLKKLKR